ncbi:hypothetical protein IYX23_02690 [Methylocystis sp. L43]|nr:hypothetical protein [Methylocystis sp. L43]MBG0804553.1 hypothetical protein [Methylocystis sp. H15]
MRRNWLTVLLFALALTVQAFAPAAAQVASRLGAGDAVSEFCFTDVASSDQSQAPAHAKGHRDVCLFCQNHCDGVAPLAARVIHLGKAPVQWTALDWTVADCALPTRLQDFSRQARAPPANS